MMYNKHICVEKSVISLAVSLDYRISALYNELEDKNVRSI